MGPGNIPGVGIARAGEQPEEERSAYALGVLRRVRQKLDGRDACKLRAALTPEGDRPLPFEQRLSVNEHVDRCGCPSCLQLLTAQLLTAAALVASAQLLTSALPARDL